MTVGYSPLPMQLLRHLTGLVHKRLSKLVLGLTSYSALRKENSQCSSEVVITVNSVARYESFRWTIYDESSWSDIAIFYKDHLQNSELYNRY